MFSMQSSILYVQSSFCINQGLTGKIIAVKSFTVDLFSAFYLFYSCVNCFKLVFVRI